MGTSWKSRKSRPKIIGNVDEPKANSIIKTPKNVKVDDKCDQYVNPITLNHVVRPTHLAVLHKIKKKYEELPQKFKRVITKNREQDQ